VIGENVENIIHFVNTENREFIKAAVDALVISP
jgi:hypothetical protein